MSEGVIKDTSQDIVKHIFGPSTNTYNAAGNSKTRQHRRTERPTQTCRQTGLGECQAVNHPTLKQKALMNILVTELIAVNYKLCSHCGPTKEDISTLQSDIITKVRRTLLCVIHPWQPTADWWPSPVKSPGSWADDHMRHTHLPSPSSSS